MQYFVKKCKNVYSYHDQIETMASDCTPALSYGSSW